MSAYFVLVGMFIIMYGHVENRPLEVDFKPKYSLLGLERDYMMWLVFVILIFV